MGLIAILRGFAGILLFTGGAMLAPLLLAMSGDEPSAGPFLFGSVLTLITGAGAWAASIGRTPSADFRGALIIILLWWVVAPAFAAIPMALGPMTFGDAYFEAIAAVTTTGGWLSREAAVQSPALMLWRAELQWMGGFASIAIAAAIFIRPAFIGIDTLLPPFSRGAKNNFLRPLRNAVLSFWSIYAAITFIAFAAFAIAGASTLDAVVMAFSGVASGGFLPGDGATGALSPWVIVLLFMLMVFSGSNFVVIARLVRGAKERVRDLENGAYLGIILFVGLFFWLLAGAGDVDLIIPHLFNSASILSTNGFTIGEAPPLSVVLVTAMIGGAAVSTAGGFKILRWLVIMRRAGEELHRLVEPSAVFGKRMVANELGVWIHFLVFTLTLAGLVVILCAGGQPFELSAAAAVSAISNAGPLIYLAEGGGNGYAAFGEPYRAALAAAMVLGRLEAAVALALINRWFWRS